MWSLCPGEGRGFAGSEAPIQPSSGPPSSGPLSSTLGTWGSATQSLVRRAQATLTSAFSFPPPGGSRPPCSWARVTPRGAHTFSEEGVKPSHESTGITQNVGTRSRGCWYKHLQMEKQLWNRAMRRTEEFGGAPGKASIADKSGERGPQPP